MRFSVDRLDHLVLNCTDVEISATWYQRVLCMEREEFGADRRTALKFGGQKINLRPLGSDALKWLTAARPLAGTADLCFVAPVGTHDVIAHLHACGIEVVLGPGAHTGALGPMNSVYCRDPDGNLIEIASYLQD